MVSRTLIICMRGYVSGTLDIGMRGPRHRGFYSSLELVSSFVRYRLPGLLKLLLCYESCHRLISPCSTGVVAASSNLRQEIVAKHTGQLLIPNAVTSIRQHFSSFKFDSLINPIHNNSHGFFSTGPEAVESLEERVHKQLRELETKSGLYLVTRQQLCSISRRWHNVGKED